MMDIILLNHTLQVVHGIVGDGQGAAFRIGNGEGNGLRQILRQNIRSLYNPIHPRSG